MAFKKAGRLEKIEFKIEIPYLAVFSQIEKSLQMNFISRTQRTKIKMINIGIEQCSKHFREYFDKNTLKISSV